jgi:tetratricopeptide (TPR) repeat protein
MTNSRVLAGLFCALILLGGCGNNMTVVRTHQKPPSTKLSNPETRWKTSYNQGLKYYNNKEYLQASELFAVALKYTSEDDYETRAWMYFSIGRCWEGLSDLAKAEQNYLMAQNLDPNLSEASDGIQRISKRRAENN